MFIIPKKIYTILLLSVLWFSCNKKEEHLTDVTNNPVTPDTTTFIITGDLYSTNPLLFEVNRPTKTMLWDFGDGTTSSANDTIIHSFDKDGTYIVKLTVNGLTYAKTVTVTGDWKSLMEVKTWTKLYRIFSPPNTIDTVSMVDTTFALQLTGLNKIMLFAEPNTAINDTVTVNRYINFGNPNYDFRTPGYTGNNPLEVGSHLVWDKTKNTVWFTRARNSSNKTYIISYYTK